QEADREVGALGELALAPAQLLPPLADAATGQLQDPRAHGEQYSAAKIALQAIKCLHSRRGGVASSDMELLPLATHPDRYRHWKLSVDGPVARLVLAVKEDAPFGGNWVLKLNSYDLGVDIELADAVDRLRFEHPEVKAVVITADRDKVF